MNNPYKIIYELRETIAELSERCREQEADIDELLKERDWISVKDRLPDKYGLYLVNRTIIPHKIVFAALWENEKFVSIGKQQQLDFITHWMPLPEPPKEDDTNA